MTLITILLFMIVFCLLRFPQQVLQSSGNACMLWFQTVLPSLFPFMVACQLLLATSSHTIGKYFSPLMRPLFGLSGSCALPLSLGFLSGYPMGAKMTAQLYQQNQISASEAKKLICFCNNPGPLFVVGTVGTGFFQSPALGYVMLCCIIIGALVTGICLRFHKTDVIPQTQITIQKQPLSMLISCAIRDSLCSVAQIGGFLVFFTVCSTCFELLGIYRHMDTILFFCDISSITLQGICTGLLEMTSGCAILATSSDTLRICASFCVCILCFGGCSILGQTITVLQQTPFCLRSYLIAKLFHAGVSTILFFVMFPIFAQKKAVPVFSAHTAAAFPQWFCFLGFALICYTLFHLLIRNS